MAGTSPEVSAWSCAACGTQWAISNIRPQFSFARFAAAVQQLGCAWSILREVIALVGEIPGLSEDQLRTRLVGLGDRASCLLEGEAR
jgi:hypothetical protein